MMADAWRGKVLVNIFMGILVGLIHSLANPAMSAAPKKTKLQYMWAALHKAAGSFTKVFG